MKSLKLMQTAAARKLLANPTVQSAMAAALRTSMQLRSDLDDAKRKTADALDLVTHDELRDLQRSVERIDRRKRRGR